MLLQARAEHGKKIDDGGRIGADETSAPVDLDVVFNTLDAKTRAGLRNVIRGYGDWYDTRGTEAGQGTKYFAPFLSSGSQLAKELTLDQAVLERFLKDGAETVSAIAERRDDLAGLVVNTNQAMAAIGDESVSLQRALELLPGTMRKANTTFVNLRGTLDDLELLVRESKPATKKLEPFFRELRPLVADLRPTIADLRDLIRLPGADNDLTELTAAQPRLAELTARCSRARSGRSTARSRWSRTPASTRPTSPAGSRSSVRWRRTTTQTATTRALCRSSARPAGTRTTRSPRCRRSSAREGFRRGILHYCPGGAVQPPPDGSAPVPAEGCNPSDSPTGP